MPTPLISICIPTYKRVYYLKRLLESIKIQTFTDFEVIVTDDSPDDSVQQLCEQYLDQLSLSYLKNQYALGTPENWNETIRRAKGEWIKIMHDDDWLSGPDSLQKFHVLAIASPNTSFVFAGYRIYENDKAQSTVTISSFDERLLRKDPRNLFCNNFIGPPSVILHRNHQQIWYDNRMKWLVDIDFYIRSLQQYPAFNFTRDILVNVGMNEQQVTNLVFHDKKVIIPETLLLLEKTGYDILNRIWNYDFAWRLMRNYNIWNLAELESLRPDVVKTALPNAISHIVRVQRRIPRSLLKIGLFSKLFMLMNYGSFRLKQLFK